MKELKQIIDELQATNGKNDKQVIIKENLDNREFVETMKFLLNDFIVTGISGKKINKAVKEIEYAVQVPYSIVNAMEYLKKNNTGSDVDIYIIQYFINHSPEELRELYKMILTKSLKIGASNDTFNKCASKEDLIPVFNVLLAKKYDDHEKKVKGDFILTKKFDGMRCVYLDGEFFSRTGQIIDGMNDLLEEIKQLPSGMVYDGELLLKNDDNLTSADLYNATIKVARKDGIKKNLEFHIFEMIDSDKFKQSIDKTPCIDRKNTLSSILNSHNFQWIKEVPMLYIGNDKSVIKTYLDKARENEEEGIILSVADSPYELKRSDKLLKIKVFQDCDARVIDVIEGTGKYEGMLGAITIQFEHEDKLWECNCGSGFKEDERVLYWSQPELLLNKIVTIGYFEISKNEQGGFGLRFPTWKSIIRDDKTEISMN